MSVGFPELNSAWDTEAKLLVVGYSPFATSTIKGTFTLFSGFGDGEKLSADLSFSKYGGLASFTLNIKRGTKIPVWPGMHLAFFYNQSAIACGYVTSVPPWDQPGSVVQITGQGLALRLQDKQISASYTSKTITEILTDLSAYFDGLGIIYNAAKINPPALTIASVSWKDKTVRQIIEDLITLANYDFNSSEYIYGVDNVGEFYFTPISQTETAASMFEGYHFQNPTVAKVNDTLVNQVILFRANSTTGKDLEYVATYDDAGSQVDNGVYSKKIVIPDYVDNTTAQKFALGILENFKNPKYSVSVQALNYLKYSNIEYPIVKLPTGEPSFIPFDFYKISTKQQDQMVTLSEFSSLTEWDRHLTDSSITVQTGMPYTGRAYFQWIKNTSSTDYIQLNFAQPVFNPQRMRLFYKTYGLPFNTPTDIMQIDLISPTYATEQQTIIDNAGNILVDDLGNELYANINQTAQVSWTIHNRSSVSFWAPYEMDLTNIVSFEGLRITVKKSCYLDRLDVFPNCYATRVLSLIDSKYTISDSRILADSATFGISSVALTDEILAIGRDSIEYQNVQAKQ